MKLPPGVSILQKLPAIAALLAASASCLAAPAAGRGVLVVVADRLTIDDLSDHSGKHPAVQDMAVGGVAPSGVGAHSAESVFASAAAGAYSRGSEGQGLLLNALEPYEAGTAAQAYSRRTGYWPPPASGIVHVGLAAVVGANRRTPHPPEVWALGKLLRSGRVLRAAFGNSDHGDQVLRMGASLLADDHGQIVRGDVGGACNLADAAAPWGLRTDLDRLLPLVVEQLKQEAVVTVEFGDLERIESQRAEYTTAAYRAARREACQELFNWLDRAASRVPDASLVLLSLVPPLSNNEKWNTLGLAAISADGFQQGLLDSNTTRTPGVVAAIDVAPTILKLAGVKEPYHLLGYPMFWSASGDPEAEVRRWNLTVSLNEDLSFVLIAALGAFAALAGCLAVLQIVRPARNPMLARGATVGLAVAVWVPLIMLLPLDRSWLYFAVAPLLVAALAAGTRWKQPLLALEVPALLTLAAVLLSSVGAIDWLKRSVVTSWQLQGLRFYGIGNEYMGVVLGAAAVIPLWRLRAPGAKPNWTGLKIWFAFWTILLGFPALGADAGGVVAACVMFGLLLRALAGKSVKPQHAAALAVVGIALALALAIVDAVVSHGAPSHLGLAVTGLSEGRYDALIGMVQRKAALNLSQWTRVETRVALVAYGAVIILWAIYRDAINSKLSLNKRTRVGLSAMAYGALAALVFNDSGLVSVAFILSYPMVWALATAVARSVPPLVVRGPLAAARR